MKLKKFSIEKYKSIYEPTDCWLASDITILAGKNESGKSTVLEALRDFGSADSDLKKCNPLGTEEKPIIKLYFSLEEEDIEKILNTIEFKSAKLERFLEKESIIISKTVENNLVFHADTIAVLSPLLYSEAENKLEIIYNSIQNILNLNIELKLNFDFDKIRNSRRINNTVTELASFLEKIEKLKDVVINNKDSFEKELLIAKEKLDEVKVYKFNIIQEILITRIPKIVYFNSFDATLPYEIELSQAKSNGPVADFIKVANIPYEKLLNTSSIRDRTNIISGCSVKISNDFKTFWKQDVIELVADVKDNKLVIGIKEENRSDQFETKERSKGFQWFLCFYLRLKAEGAEEGNSIILVDEPGLYLHAKAQKDVMIVLENLSKESSQIIFSTHSPYLLDSSRFDRIKLVNKVGGRTSIQNKIHKDASYDTLTPIRTSIGISLSDDIHFPYSDNAIVEGISDYYYLMALNKILKKDNLIPKIIPSVGVTNIPNLISILHGWGLNYVAVLDKEPKGKKVYKNLMNNGFDESKIIFISENDGFSIEDLFSLEDFNKYVIFESDEKNDVSSLNSVFLKNKHFDKVLLSKKFFESALGANMKLSKETLDGFDKLFKKINANFNSKKELKAIAKVA